MPTCFSRPTYLGRLTWPRKGLVARRQNLLGNRLVIVVPDDSKLDVKKPEDLLAAGNRARGHGRSAVRAGRKICQAGLEKLGLWETTESRRSPRPDDVRGALTYVETGAAEAGIVYATDAAISKKVKVAAEHSASLTGPDPLSDRAAETRRRRRGGGILLQVPPLTGIAQGVSEVRVHILADARDAGKSGG